MKFLEEFIAIQDEELIRKLYITLQQEQSRDTSQPNKSKLSNFVGI
ncbi:MAG: hypothetical protein WBA23_08745 [Tunicatimonas sp.]